MVDLAVTVTIVKVVAFLAIVTAALGLGAWLGVQTVRKQGNIPEGTSAIGHLRAGMRRRRRARRELLTLGERIFAGTMVILSGVAVPTGVIALLLGDSSLHPVGIALLVLGLVVMAVPTAPILQARVRRRQGADEHR
jgi:ABC-type transporter Mla maintaining outer membrane lipid asymmetry permease subunit MlaE